MFLSNFLFSDSVTSIYSLCTGFVTSQEEMRMNKVLGLQKSDTCMNGGVTSYDSNEV